MEFYQWLVPIIAFIYIIRLIKQYRQQKRLLGSTFIWLLFWIAIGILAIVPDPVSINIAHILGFKSHINAVIFVALGFLIIFMFYMTAVVEKLEKQLTEIVRKLALENQKMREQLTEKEKAENEDSVHS